MIFNDFYILLFCKFHFVLFGKHLYYVKILSLCACNRDSRLNKIELIGNLEIVIILCLSMYNMNCSKDNEAMISYFRFFL